METWATEGLVKKLDKNLGNRDLSWVTNHHMNQDIPICICYLKIDYDYSVYKQQLMIQQWK